MCTQYPCTCTHNATGTDTPQRWLLPSYNQDRVLGVLPFQHVGPRVVLGLGWLSQPTSQPSLTFPCAPGCHRSTCLATESMWVMMYTWRKYTHWCVSRHLGIAAPHTLARTCAHVHADTTTHFSSQKNTEPSKARPPGMSGVFSPCVS